jgi:hypothetical protein
LSVDSDGAEGDSEDPRCRIEIAPARRRWRMWNESQRAGDRTYGRRSKSCHSVMTHAAIQSGRLAPATQAESLGDFLGESVPLCPF